MTSLKMGITVEQWENENSVSAVNEKQVVGAVKLKEGTTYNHRLAGTRIERPFNYNATDSESLW